MTEDIDIWRRKLRFRAWHRGTKELDLIMGHFADRFLEGFDAAQLARFETLLDLPDTDMQAWVTGVEEPPSMVLSDVFTLLRDFDIAAVLQDSGTAPTSSS